jgi:hypothetical protein
MEKLSGIEDSWEPEDILREYWARTVRNRVDTKTRRYLPTMSTEPTSCNKHISF